ncbi:MAG: hypothetical protein ACI9FJ_001031 [Alteromonadaceae bacterium]|jgi:hypothetical protein
MNLHQLAIKTAEQGLDTLITNYQRGWLDGGCFTFAWAFCRAMPEQCRAYHVSRIREVPDHGVVFLPAINRFLDADGLQTKEQLLYKMRHVELTYVQDVWAFEDIQNYPIYHDISLQLIAYIKSKNLA